MGDCSRWTSNWPRDLKQLTLPKWQIWRFSSSFGRWSCYLISSALIFLGWLYNVLLHFIAVHSDSLKLSNYVNNLNNIKLSSCKQLSWMRSIIDKWLVYEAAWSFFYLWPHIGIPSFNFMPRHHHPMEHVWGQRWCSFLATGASLGLEGFFWLENFAAWRTRSKSTKTLRNMVAWYSDQ